MLKNEKIVNALLESKIVAVVRGANDPETVVDLAKALYKGGIKFIETTFNASNPTSWNTTAMAIRAMAVEFDKTDDAYIGAGTVLNKKQLNLAFAAGAQYIVSPSFDRRIVKATKKYGLMSLPGVLTPSECVDALKAGADFLKLFPISSFGAQYIKAIKAPLNHAKFLAVGGITLDNIETIAPTGVCGFGIGGNLVDLKAIENGEFNKIEQLARQYVEKVNQYIK